MKAYTKKEGYFTIKYLHNSSDCSSCTNTIEYYKLRAQVMADTENFDPNRGDLCGLITFLIFMEGKILNGTQATLAEYNLIKKENEKLLESERFQAIHQILGFKSSKLYHRLNALFIKFKNYENVHRHVKEKCLNALDNSHKRTLCSSSRKESTNVQSSVTNFQQKTTNNLGRKKGIQSHYSRTITPKKKLSANSVTLARTLKKNYFKSLKNCSKKECANRFKKRAFPKPFRTKDSVSVLKKTASKAYNKIKKKKLKSSLPTGDKLPAKGTLKRKRWYLEKLKTTESYEDDIFEKRNNLYRFQNLVEDASDDVYDIATPTWATSLSPRRERSNSPTFEDCYNEQELLHSRKEAVHYIFRRQKRKSQRMSKDKSINPSKTKKPVHKKQESDTTHQLQEACNVLSKLKDELASDSEDDEDYYFSDVEE